VNLSPRQALLRQLLVNAGSRGVTTAEILQAGVGSRYGQRIKELRDDHGLVIEASRETQSRWRYTLTPDVQRGGEAAVSPPSPRQSTSPAPRTVDTASLSTGGLFDDAQFVKRGDYRDAEAA
jgi:hypothetical protein